MHGNPLMIVRVLPAGNRYHFAVRRRGQDAVCHPPRRQTSITPPDIFSVSRSQFAPSVDLKIAVLARRRVSRCAAGLG